ncbi:hypothetical protein SDC9_131737 [bioreactor metagenome]|uniref:Uncharacterized protein n=1 Tax=bioreactor metagenome TaxID=1076179 RepID=A0A645D5S0_9ZZZZ
MDAGAEIRHKQEFEDVVALAFERHDEPGDADALAVQAALDRRLVPFLAHLGEQFTGLGIGILQPLQIDALEHRHRVPVGRHQVVPHQFAEALEVALARGQTLADAVIGGRQGERQGQ